MNSIKFSHRYKKMPHGVEYLETWVVGVKHIHYKDLSPDFIAQDTETVDGQFYELPKTELIIISLWSDTIGLPGTTEKGHTWQTIRRFTPEKFDYYRGLKGKQVKIELVLDKPSN